VLAFLDANYPGQAGGEAIAGALMGEFSPNARLPYTIYAADFAKQRPDPTDHYLDSPPFGLTYMYWRGSAPLFPFGHGLSYAEFGSEFQSQQLTAIVGENDEDVAVSMHVWRSHNDGFVGESAKFSVLLFASYVGAGDGEDQTIFPSVSSQPIKKLVAFEKLVLSHGEQQVVTLRPSLMRGLAAVADDGSYVLQGGNYALSSPCGRGADNAHASLTLQDAAKEGSEARSQGSILRVDSYLPHARARASNVADRQ
jgi:beta-glucosidase